MKYSDASHANHHYDEYFFNPLQINKEIKRMALCAIYFIIMQRIMFSLIDHK